jgi:hypothetical protein
VSGCQAVFTLYVIARFPVFGKVARMNLREQIRKVLDDKRNGKSRSKLAEHMGWHPNIVTRILAGDRRILADEVPGITEYLEIGRGIPIVGSVGAGAEAHFYGDADDPAETIPAPAETPVGAVGVDIRGDSLGKTYNGWVAIYGEREGGLPPSYEGQLCVLWLRDGRVLIKQPRPSRVPGQHHLTSDFSEPIMDVEIDFSAKVLGIIRKP